MNKKRKKLIKGNQIAVYFTPSQLSVLNKLVPECFGSRSEALRRSFDLLTKTSPYKEYLQDIKKE